MKLLHEMPWFEKFAPVLGRILVAALFIPAGWNKLVGFEQTAQWIASAGIPFAELCVVIAIVVELIGGIMILVGYKTRMAACVLAVFTAIITPIFHPLSDPMQAMAFFKNFAIVGGLLYMATYGAQAVAVKKCPMPKA